MSLNDAFEFMHRSPGFLKYSFLILLLRITLLYLGLFFCLRLAFCYFNFPSDNDETFYGYLLAFVVGLRFDLFVISFALMLPAILLFVHQAFFPRTRLLLHIVHLLLLLVAALVLFMSCADIPYFTQFGSHITESVTVWRLTPGYALALIFSSFAYWGFSLLFVLTYTIFSVLLKRRMRRYALHVAEGRHQRPLVNFALLLVAAFFLFWAARGRLSQKSPIHEGVAIVSHNAFVNQIALNPSFTFAKSLGRHDHVGGFENIKQDLAFCRRFYPGHHFPDSGQVAATSVPGVASDSMRRMNVVVVLMESLSMAKMGYYHNPNLSPQLTQLAGRSVFFDRFFSSGIHTFNGLFSSVSGYPCIYTEQGLRRYTRRAFPTLAKLLKPYGYQSWFCATHDPVFDNMEGFFRLNGFDHILSSNDFNADQSLGVTGVPDHLLYERLVSQMSSMNSDQPFLAWVMTGTDHGPWAIPTDIPFHPDGKTEKERASQYADWAVGQFIAKARKEPWFDNTIFIFTGDHGQITYDVYDMPITYHHVPFIVYCPKLLSPAVNHHLGFQPDITATVAALLKLNYVNTGFGVNVFDEARPFVFFSADDKIGCVTDDDLFFYHLLNSNEKHLYRYTNMSRTDLYSTHKTRADSIYQQVQSLYTSARYIIHKNYLNF